jgi:hypothetical protein
VNDVVDFGNVDIKYTYDTEDDNPTPFIMRNDGNYPADLINVSANQSLFTAEPLGTKYFQFKAGNSTEERSFNYSGSLTEWTNVTSQNKSIIKQLNYTDTADEAQVEIRIEVPSAEPPGVLTSWLIFVWEEWPS